MIDLMQATQDGIFELANVPTVTILAPVYTNVPKGTEPPFIEIGAIDAQEIGGKDSGLEQHAVEIDFQSRGPSKRPLFAMMHAVREAIEGKSITISGALLEDPRWIASATDREEDGVTYHGIHRFELMAQADD